MPAPHVLDYKEKFCTTLFEDVIYIYFFLVD